MVPQPLTRARAAGLRRCFAVIPFVMGFVLPVGVMFMHAAHPDAWVSLDLARALGNTLTVGLSAAVLTVIAALFMVYGVRLSGTGLPRYLLPVTTIGYAAPGAVLAVGLLIPLAALRSPARRHGAGR